jgi:hypothetical protein
MRQKFEKLKILSQCNFCKKHWFLNVQPALGIAPLRMTQSKGGPQGHRTERSHAESQTTREAAFAAVSIRKAAGLWETGRIMGRWKCSKRNQNVWIIA